MKDLNRIPTDSLDSMLLRNEREEAFNILVENNKHTKNIRISKQMYCITKITHDIISVETGHKKVTIFRNISTVDWQNYLEVAIWDGENFDTGPRFSVEFGAKELIKECIKSIYNNATPEESMQFFLDLDKSLYEAEVA